MMIGGHDPKAATGETLVTARLASRGDSFWERLPSGLVLLGLWLATLLGLLALLIRS